MAKKISKKSSKKSIEDTISHKLKGPLTTISLYSEALLTDGAGEITPKQREYLEEIHKASKKMVQKVKELTEVLKK